MTEITLRYSNRKYIITCKGHNNNERVCAGISAILQGLIWYLKKWGEDFYYEQEDGYLLIRFGDNFQCTTVYRLIEESLVGIMNGYPELVSVKEVH